MKTLLSCFISAALLTLPTAGFAASKTVTLDVPGMTCEMCPLTIRKALQKVSGVSQVAVSFEKRQAVVTFDDAKITVEALTQATGNAGYPATVKGN